MGPLAHHLAKLKDFVLLSWSSLKTLPLVVMSVWTHEHVAESYLTGQSILPASLQCYSTSAGHSHMQFSLVRNGLVKEA